MSEKQQEGNDFGIFPIAGKVKVYQLDRRTAKSGNEFARMVVGWMGPVFGEYISMTITLTAFGELDEEIEQGDIIEFNDAKLAIVPSKTWEMVKKESEDYKPVRFPELTIDAEDVEFVEKGDPTGDKDDSSRRARGGRGGRGSRGSGASGTGRGKDKPKKKKGRARRSRDDDEDDGDDDFEDLFE